MDAPRIGSLHRSALAVGLLFSLGGAAMILQGSILASRARRAADAEGALARSAAAHFLDSLERDAVTTQLEHLEARRESYRHFAAARRERAVGTFLLFAGLLAVGVTRVSSGITREDATTHEPQPGP